MNVVLFIILGLLGLSLIVAGVGVFFWIRNKKNQKFLFHLHLQEGLQIRTLFATIKSDPKNPMNKRFFFDKTTSIEIRDPTSYVDGKPCRDIIPDKNGGYTYLDKTIIDKEKIKFAMNPEQKTAFLFRLRNFENRFQTSMNKRELAVLAMNLALIIILVIANIYVVIQSSKVLKNGLAIAKENKDTVNVLNKVSSNIVTATDQLAIISASVTNSSTSLVRRLS